MVERKRAARTWSPHHLISFSIPQIGQSCILRIPFRWICVPQARHWYFDSRLTVAYRNGFAVLLKAGSQGAGTPRTWKLSFVVDLIDIRDGPRRSPLLYHTTGQPKKKEKMIAWKRAARTWTSPLIYFFFALCLCGCKDIQKFLKWCISFFLH